MNAPVLLAQLAGSTTQTTPSPKNLKLEKPQNGQAVSVHLDGNTKLDFADIASEKLTFVKVGEKLIILFDNQSTVTVDPVFDSMGKPLTDLAFDMGSDRTLTGEQFAQTFPITTDQSVLPAAGGATGPTGGANFGDASVQALGASGARLGLLAGEDGGSGFDNLDDGTPNPSPIPGGVTAVTLNEDGFAEGNPGGAGDSGGIATSVTGSLNVDFGTDFVNRSFAFSLNQPTLAGLTSDGQAVQLAFTTVNGQPVMIGYVGGDFTVAANQVFTVSLDASSLQGSYTFTLLRPLDHPIHGTEDTINLSINVIATDGSGDTAPVTISIGINDDTPVIGTPADAALTDPLSGNPATQTGSLGISWGADRYNDHVDGGVSPTTGGTGDRSVVFANTQVTATGDGTTAIGTLTSHGETVHYVLLENGTALVGYTGDTAPTTLPSGEVSSNIVFVVTLSDASNSGSYVVTQYRSLDHDQGTTTFQTIDLAFNFTATDSDGDTVNGTLHAVITDTVTVVTAPADDSTLSEGNGQMPPSEGGEEMPSLLVVGGSFTPKDTGNVSLHIDWRSDNQNPTAAGGAHDRSVIFTPATQTALESLGLTSDGATIIYTISADGTLLTATTAATEGHSARTIFTVQLSDSGNGSYDFTLLDNLDHRGSSGSSQALTFGFIATDSDGDSTAPANFTVNITDDVPTAGGIETRTLSEQTQNGQTNDFVSTSLDNVSLNINWGADDVNNNGASIDRKVAFTTAAAPSGLTSNGETITYTLSENGTLLTAAAGDRVIFTVKLSDVDSGTYTFKLLDNIDHVGNNGASIALGFNFTATDADGDPVNSSFTVNVTDDVPSTGEIAGQTLFESTSTESSNAFIAKALNGISLNVDWNSDDANAGGTNDRSVAFTTSSAPSGLTSNGVSIVYTLSEDGTLLTATAGARTVFTVKLSDTGNGTYTFNLLDNLDHTGANGASLPLTFSFTATDSDGDTTSPSSFTVTVTDDVPSIGSPETATVVESTSASSSNAFISATATGSLAVDWNSDDNNQVSGPGANDRSVAFTAATLTSLNALHLTSNGTSLTFSLSDNGQLLTAKAGGTTVFTVQLSDTANGTYTFKLLDNLDHASGNDKNDLALTFGFTATDSDGDTTAPASFTVHVTDDVPVAGVGDTRGVDEDDLLSGTSPNLFDLQVGGRLNIDWNSDDHDGGNIANRSVSFEHTTAADNVAVRDANNNLVNLTSDGAAVHYAIIGGELVAYTGNNPFFNRVFVVSLDDDNTGSYTFTLLGHVDHPTADGQNTLTFTFDYTATDSDGDKSSSVFSVTVKDDVPTIGNTESESVREDSLPTTFYDTTFPDAPNSTVQLGDLNINWGADNNNSGTTNNRSVIFTTAAGATGLTSDGTAIVYSISADGTVLTAKAGSRTVFTIELSDSSDGSYKFTLFDNIDHAASGPNDDSMTLSFGIKATDSDGDSATASFAVTIVDDAPEAHTGDSRTINENDLSNGTSPNASGLTATGDLNISWGSDDANPTSGGGLGDRAVGFRFSSAADNVDAENSFGQNLTLRSDGQTVQYAFDGKTLVGYIGANLASGTRIFEVTLSDANDGSYTFKLLGNLDHPAGSGANIVNLTFSYTATDGDGDTSSSVFTVTIRDDVPEIGAPVASTLTEDTTGAAGSETFVTQTSLNKSLNINWGADDNNSGTANRSVAFSSSIDTGDSVHTTGSGSPVLKSNGVTVQFLRVSDTEIWGIANDNGGQLTLNDRKVFHITLSDSGNGTYTFELLDNIDHVGSGQGSALSLQLGFVATDADGDTDSSSFTVTINDDNGRPSIGTAEAVSVDEDGLMGGNTQPATGDLPGAATSATGSLAISWGADDNNSGSADRSVAFTGITNGQNASSSAGLLTVDGVQVKLWVVGDTVYGYTGNNPPNGSTPPSAGSQVFTVSLSDLGAGSYTFNLLKHLDHPAGNNENDISLSFGYRATDSDGDVTASSTFTVTVNDDAPVTTGAITASKTLDDDSFLGGNAGGTGDVTDATSATGAASALFSAGADGFKSVVLNATTSFSAIYKDANGFALQESVSWGSPSVSNGVTTWTAVGSVSGLTVATLAIGSNGSYTFTTFKPLVHPTAGTTEEDLSLTFNYTVTDADNDPATGSLTVKVNDDTPVSKGTVTAATTLDDEAQTLFPANTATVTGDVSTDVKTVSGAAGSLFTAGADGVKSIAMTSATFGVIYKDANGFAQTETATWGSPVVGANGVTTWTATSAHYGSAAVLVINADGSYSVTVNAPVVHPTNSATEENKALTFNITVTDGDGDTATGSLTVNVNDDTVVLGTAVAGFVDEGNLAGGNKNDGYPGDLTAAQGDNGTRSTSGSLAIAFGADGKAATVTGGTSTQTFTFSGTSTLTADLIVTQGTVNHPSASGIVFGGLNNPIIINANDSLPFKLDAIDLGLSGAATTPTVILKGYDSNNNLVATYTLSVANVAALTSGTPTHFDATGTPFANVLIDRLEIYTGSGFSGYVMADNLVVTQNTASGPVVLDAAVTFTDHSNGLANLVVKDANGHDVTASLTSNGQAVHYAMIDAVTLVGYTGATAPTSLTDPRVVFSAVLSSASANGSYTFTQVANLDHPIAGQEDDLTFTFNFTAKDGDGDKANGHFTVTVDDDAPVATAAVLTGAVYENELSTATGDLSTGTQAGNADNKNGDAGTDDSILVGNLSSLVSMGADSAGSFVVETTNLSASLTSLTSGGVALTYTVVGNTLIAWAGTNQIFTFAVDATTGAYTFTLKGQIDHVANYVIDNASIPVAAIDQPGEIYAVAAINGNPRAFEGRLPDGDVIISVTNSGNTAVNWVLHSTGGGTDYPLSIAANTTIFINVGQISTPPNAHFELTGPSAPNGQTTVNSGHQDIVATGGTDALALDLSSAVTVRDGDGDTVALHDQLTVTITDDAPVIVSSAVVGTVDETNTPLVQVAYGSLKVSIGADKIGAHMDFATYGNGTPQHPASLSSDGVGLNYVLRTTEYGEKQLVAFKFGDTVDNPVFIVALSSPSNPTYIFTLFQNLDHAPNSNTMDLAFTIRVTDGDGDYVDQTIHVNVTDSVPTIPATTVQRADVQDDALVNGNPEAGDTATASGTLSFNYGADSNGHLSWVSATLPNGGFSSVVNGNVFEIYQLQNSVNVKVFTVTLNPTTGEYQVQQLAAVHHPDGAGELGETFNLTYRVTDGDGDYVDGSLSVVVGDDVPVIIGNATQVNLLSNGDFSGGSAWHDASYGAWATEATGWKISGTVPGQTGVQLERVPSGYFGVVTSNGEPMVDLGATPGNIAISQTLTGLTVGQHYTLSFEIGTYDPSSSGLQVYWNGQLVGTYAPGSTMAIQTLDLIAAGGPNTVTFKEVGNASDNTGTYLANVSLVQASSTSLPLFHADIGEDGSSVVSLVSGTNYRFGADGPGSVAFDTVHATISTPTGTLIGVPSMSYDPVTGKVTVNPGWGFNGLSEGEIATLSVPFTVTDSDGDTKTGIYQFTIHGTNDAVRTSEGFPDAGTMTEYAETDPRAGSSTDRVEFDAPPGYGGLNGGGFWIYDDQGDTHTLTVTPQAAGYLGHLTAVVSEETVNDGAGFVNWQYHVTDADLNPLAQGETKIEKFTITVADGHGSTTSREITVTLVGTNDSPVITTSSASAIVFENGDLDAVGADQAANFHFEPNVNVDTFLQTHLVSGVNMATLLTQVQAAIGPQASLADAIATVWDYIDDNGSYYNNLLNEMSARLGVEYAKYLEAGGKPLLDVIAKYVADGDSDGIADRLQSLHDNLLGNLHGPSLIDKLLGAGQGSNPNPVPGVYADIVNLLSNAGLSDLLSRPIYGGYETDTNTSLAWDQQHGLVPVAAGQLAATDVDHGAVLTWSGTTTTAFGTFTISASGAWTYTLNQSGEADKLAEGETKVETFTATVTDEFGATDTIPVTITIKGANDAPVVDLSGPATAGNDVSVGAVEQMAQWIFNSATITDVDSSTMHSMKVTLTSQPDGLGLEGLSLNMTATNALTAAGLTYSYDAATGVLTITGDASTATYQTILRGVVYQYTGDAPSTGDRTVTVVVNDGLDSSISHTGTVHIAPMNDPPVLGGTLSANVVEGGTHVLTASELGYTDPDNTSSEVVFRVSNVQHGVITNGGAPATSFTAAELAAGLIKFTHDGSDDAPTTFQVAVEDGNQDGSTPVPGTFTFTVLGVNDAPVNTLPAGSLTVNEDTPLAITGLSISDSDAGSSTMTTTLSVTSGTITVLGGSGVTVTNNGTGSVTLSGSQADINAALAQNNGVVYQDALNHNGGVDLTVTTSDLGHSGSGGTLTDTDTIHINVTPVNDAPVIVGYTSGAGAGEDAAMYPPVKYIGNMAVSDPDGGPPIGQLVGTAISVSSGSLTTAQQDAITAALITGKFAFTDVTTDANGNKVVNWELTAPGAVNLDFLAAGQNLTVTFNMAVSDGMATSSTVSYNIVFAGTNDAPVAVANSVAVNEDATVSATTYATGVLGNDSDVDSGDTLNVSAILAGTSGTAVAVSSDLSSPTVIAGTYGSLTIKADGTFQYSPNNSAAQSLAAGAHATDVFTYTVVDSHGASTTSTLTMNITGVNDVPHLNYVSSSMTEDAGSKVFDVLGNGNATLDPDSGAPNNVTLGTVTVYGGSGYQIDASDVEVTWTTGGIQVKLIGDDWNKLPTAAQLVVSVGYTLHGDQPTDLANQSLDVTVTGVNDAPVLDASKTPFMSVGEGAGVPSGAVGSLVSALIGIGNYSDVDGTGSGIAVTGAGNTHGTWYYSLNGGSSWVAVGAVSDTQSLLLTSTARVYFKPAAGYTGTADELTFRGWDALAGEGGKVDTTSNGGTTHYSAASDTVSVTVASANHAPDLVNGTYGGTVTGQVHALPASALVNGSFESGGTGWTVASQEGGASFSSNFPADGSGNFTANSFGQATGIKTQLTQVVDTLPGLQYTLSFQVLSVSLTPGAHVYVNWNGVQVLAVATAQASGSYHTFTATVTGTGHDTLQFGVDDPNNNPATFDSWRFDAVSLTPAAHYESTSGTIAFTDLDAADTHSVTVSTPVGSNYIGTFVPTVDDVTHQVKWTFYASDTDLQAMTSSTANQTYTIKISDGHGGFDTQDVTVTVAKHVDAAPVITSSAQTGSVTEDASIGVVNLVQNPTFELPDIFNPVLTPWTVSGAGQVHINGSGANGSVDAAYLDQNTTLSQTITTQIGTTYTIDFFLHNYGTPFSVNINGTPVWTTSNVVSSWTEYSVTFTATSTSTVLSFATTGVNGADIDEVSVQAGTKHIVAGIETNAGTITYTDADLGDTHTVAASGPTFTWSGGSLSQAQIDALTNASSLTLNATDSAGTGQGSVAWKHSIADSAIQFLNAGQTLTETYTVTIDDGQGGTTSQQVTITINGTNEPVAPTGQTGTLAITEDVTRVLTLSDFGYSDADGDAMASVKISSISITNGKLLYGTSQVTNNQVISAADILAGMLSFAPADDLRSGNSTNGTFAFKVTDSSGMTDATSRTMTLAIGADQFDAATSSSGGTTVTAAALNSGFGSYSESGGSGDIFRITTSGATTYTNLNFLRSDNNLEVGWSASGGTGYATLLNQYGNSNQFFETFHFQNGGSYAGYTLAGTSSGGAYTLLSGLTSNSGLNLIIAGTEGNDTISTINGTGNNLLFGNGGSDTITGGSGNDLIVGGLGNDTLGGWSGNDTYVFGLTDGNDTISEFTGTDRIVIKTGGAAMSGLFAYDNNATSSLGDLVIQYNGQQITVQNHFFMNGYEVEAINFDGGSVYGYALGSNDYAIPTGVAADPFEVGGYRTISIASGNNFISGEIDTANKITGGSGNDLIFGGDQGDILAGGNGNNLIVGGKGNDTLGAGTGNDVYAFGMTDGTDTITDTSGTDAIFIATRGAAMSMLTATDNNNGNSHGDLVIQYNGQQVTVVNHFDGGASGANSVESIAFDGGSVYGYDLGTASYAISNLDPNNAGGARTVDLSATSVNNFIAGEDGTSNVITGGSAKDLIFGGSQNDTLSGGAGNDLIQGGAGDDILMGGLGNDVLRGGSGADTFKFGAGHIGAANLDSILDFSNAEGDKIDISGLLDSIAGVQADGSNINSYVHLAQSGNNVVVQVDTTGTGNFSGTSHDVATLVGYGTSNADIVNMVFKNTDHTMTA
ncbi:T1SS-143 repeat domain-containing protein [Tardiphaga sp. 768_D3_N2_1]|uniref:T1SS-143 repeat domain-containing protein n=1 Tax=Tardiphaga sp. 768_D3_N2_1 TaxID=3240783 RepID=UPI003F8B5A63